MEQINQDQQQPLPNQDAQTAPADAQKKTTIKSSDTWVTYEEIKAAVAHGNLDPFNTTAKAVQDILQVMVGKKGSPNSIYSALDKLKLEVAPKLPDALEPIPIPKEMQLANAAHWDSAVSLVRASYLHKVEKQRTELETLTLQKESLTRERTEQTERADSLSTELEETKEKSAADFEVINQTMEKLTEQMLAMDKQIVALKEAHEKELHEAAEMLNAANAESNHIKSEHEQEIKLLERDVKILENSIDRAGERDSQLRLQVREANDRADAAIREANARADAAMKRADEYAKQMTDMLSKATAAKAPGQN